MGDNNTSVIMNIKRAYRDLSKKEKKIADYIIKDPKSVSKLAIADFAKELHLADSTIYQFTKKIGYEGYRDLKIALLTENFDPEISIHENISPSDDELTISKKVFASSIRALQETESLINPNTLKKTADAMMTSEKVTFFGFGGSNAVALDSYHKFLRSPISCNYSSDAHIQLMNASLLTNKDCAFIISHSGLSKDAIAVADLANEKGATVIALTSYPLSLLAKKASIVLVSTADEIMYRSESLSSRLSQLSIIDTLFVITMFRNQQKAEKSLAKVRHAISLTKEQF